MASPYKIAVLGLWHLGEVYSAGLADLGHAVIGISEDSALIDNFKKAIPPLPEPELQELIQKNLLSGWLSFSADFEEIKNCNVLWFTFDTHVNDADEVDLSPIWQNLEKSLPFVSEKTLIVVTSQVPIGTSRKICEFIKTERPDLIFDYAYTPENLRLGEAVRCFFNPTRIIIGANSGDSSRKMKEIFSGLNTDFLEMSAASAEMSKHAINSFLATSVSFINDIADACEKTGADVLSVSRALRSESRIGPKAFLDAGLGFSGATLGRDLKILMNLANERKLDLPIIKNVFAKNESRKNAAISKIVSHLNSVTDKTIGIFGLTYKAGTKTLRRSRSMEIAQELKKLGATLKLHDPEAEEVEISTYGQFDFSRDPYKIAEGADALIFITPWPSFKNLDLPKLSNLAKSKALFFDTSNFFWDKEEKIKKIGFTYLGIGRS
ncbi:MAG: nucleotide sugar dehydrogenase [Patescibacteria group bacterium]